MGKIAFVFAGQGAQYTGMGRSLFESSPAARQVFDCADHIRPGTSEQCFTAEKEILSQTCNTQPCLFAVDLSCAEALREAGVTPDGAAGFSLGEIAALAFCGLLSREEAFTLVCRRGILMDGCARQKPGAMLAVLKLSIAQVEELCAQVGEVYPVNYNCPGQLVVAAPSEKLTVLAGMVADAGGKCVPLAVSGAFHSPFMEEASQGLREELKKLTLHAPALPLYANATARPYTAEQAPELIASQVKSPVRWQETIEGMTADGFDTFVEVGPGKTLSGLIKKISRESRVFRVEDNESLQACVAELR